MKLESTLISCVVSPGSTSMLLIICRVRDGGSSAQAMPVSRRATRAPNVCLSSSKDRELVLLGYIVLDVAVRVEDRNRFASPGITVGPAAHPIADVVGQQLQPFVKAPLVEQTDFPVEELFDLAGNILIYARHDRSSTIRYRAALEPSCRPASAAPTAHKTADDCFR